MTYFEEVKKERKSLNNSNHIENTRKVGRIIENRKINYKDIISNESIRTGHKTRGGTETRIQTYKRVNRESYR